jgi:hypothetical protein
MYAPLLFVSLLHTLILLQALKRGQWPWWALYVGVLVVGVFLHIFMIFNALLHVLWMLCYHRRVLWVYLASGCAAAVLAFPLTLHWTQVLWRLLLDPNSTSHAQNIASGDRVGFEWGAIPYTFYSYGVGFSLGPSIAGLHADRSLTYLLQFLPSLLSVGVVFGALLTTGVYSLSRYENRAAFWLILLGLLVPIGAAALFTVLAAFSYNVRYTIIAYPYFCILLGSGCVALARWRTGGGVLAVLALALLLGFSLVNYYRHPDYANADIRAAVTLWRSVEPDGYLLSCCAASGVRRVVDRYLSPTERKRHIFLGGRNVISQAQAFFDTHDVRSAYIFFNRDWRQRRENVIRAHYELREVQMFAGVRLMQISQK